MMKNFLFLLNVNLLGIKNTNINIDPIKINNIECIPLTKEFFQKENGFFSKKQERIIETINLINFFKEKCMLKKEEEETILFNEFSTLNNFHKTSNIIFSILFMGISIFSGIAIIDCYKHKEFEIDNILNSLKDNYILYSIYTLINILMLWFFNWFFINKEFYKYAFLYMIIFSLFLLLSVKIINSSINWLFNIENVNSNEFRSLFLIELILSIGRLLYWRFYTYPNNKKYFDKNIKPKFEKLNRYLIKQEYTTNSFNNNIKYIDTMIYIPENKKEEFKREILSL